MWLTLSDSNTTYFHPVTKGGRAKNKLLVIEDENRTVVYEEEQVADVICKFYKKLFTSVPADGSPVVEKALAPCVTQQMNDFLTQQSSPLEIKEALFAIHADKAPGVDGFSASFFQTNWSVVGPSIICEIQAFFSS